MNPRDTAGSSAKAATAAPMPSGPTPTPSPTTTAVPRGCRVTPAPSPSAAPATPETWAIPWKVPMACTRLATPASPGVGTRISRKRTRTPAGPVMARMARARCSPAWRPTGSWTRTTMAGRASVWPRVHP